MDEPENKTGESSQSLKTTVRVLHDSLYLFVQNRQIDADRTWICGFLGLVGGGGELSKE